MMRTEQEGKEEEEDEEVISGGGGRNSRNVGVSHLKENIEDDKIKTRNYTNEQIRLND